MKHIHKRLFEMRCWIKMLIKMKFDHQKPIIIQLFIFPIDFQSHMICFSTQIEWHYSLSIVYERERDATKRWKISQFSFMIYNMKFSNSNHSKREKWHRVIWVTESFQLHFPQPSTILFALLTSSHNSLWHLMWKIHVLHFQMMWNLWVNLPAISTNITLPLLVLSVIYYNTFHSFHTCVSDVNVM